MKLHAYIVEDEKTHFDLITEVLNELPDVKVVNLYRNDPYPYKTALAEIKDRRPNLIILDHDLNEGENHTGFDLFLEIKDVHSFVVFCSQYPVARGNDAEYSNAKFVEKVFTETTTNFQKTVNKAKLKDHFERVVKAARDYFAKYPEALRLVLHSSGREIVVNASDIVYIEGHGAKSTVYFNNGRAPITIGKPLGKFYEYHSLNEVGFIRVSKSFIINPYMITSVQREKDSQSKTKVVLSTTYDKKEITVGSTFYEDGSFTKAFLSLFKRRK